MDDTGETFKVEFDVPVPVTLDPEFHNMAWDHALKTAHEKGVIPVGPIHIETELIKVEVSGSLVEGQPMRVQQMMQALGLPEEFVRVTATMMVGSRLDID